MSQIVNALQTQVASAVGGVGTSAKIFQYAPLPFAPSGQGLTGGVTLAIPGTARLNGKQFQVRASGNVTVAGTSPTVQLQLLGAIPGGNNVVLAQSTARTVTTSASYAWALEATLQGDNLSAILQGWFSDAINNVVDTQAALTNTLTGVNFGTIAASGASNGASYPTSGYLPLNAGDEPAINLQFALVFGVSNAANAGNLLEFFATIN
jgi:hypothetical protein